MDPFNLQGYIGECMVQLELAKRGVRLLKVIDHGFDFDFLASTGARLEVKTANPSITVHGKYTEWRFLNKRDRWVRNGDKSYAHVQVPRDRQCDFFVMVGRLANEERILGWRSVLDMSEVPITAGRFFVIPKSEVGRVTNISIFKDRECKWSQWEGKWDLIVNYAR